MKKIIIILLLSIVYTGTLAQNMSVEDIVTVAINFMRRQGGCSLEISSTEPIIYEGIPCIYHVTFADSTWCYVSSDRRTTPILAYGLSGNFFDDIPSAFVNWKNQYLEQLASIKKLRNYNMTNNHYWDSLMISERSFPTQYQPNNSLLNSTGRGEIIWKQSTNNESGCSPSYNMDCPTGLLTDCTCGRTPVGCGAVAMGMTMWYWQWPKTYEWELMPPKMTGSTPYNEATTIAEFLHYCGWLSSMTYMCGGSSTIGPNIKNALNEKSYKSVRLYSKSDWRPWAWRCLLLAEIDSRRPVILYGQPNNINFTDGHFFVVDGYKYSPDLMFHINFGHGDADTWCSIDDFHEGDDNYTYQQAALVGISPTYNERDIYQVHYSEIIPNNWKTEYAYSTIALPESGHQLQVYSGAKLYLEAGDQIVLNPGFIASEGSEVKLHINPGLLEEMEISLLSLPNYIIQGEAYIITSKNADSWEFTVKETSFMSSSTVYQAAGVIHDDITELWDNVNLTAGTYQASIVLKNSYGRRLEKRIRIEVSHGSNNNIITFTPLEDNDNYPSTSIDSDSLFYTIPMNHLELDDANICPNPTDGQVTVAADGDVEAIVIYTADGRPVGGWKILSLSGDHVTLDVGPLPDGLYILSLRTMSGTATHKLTKMKQ